MTRRTAFEPRTSAPALEAQFLAAVEVHKSHPPRLRRDRDGIYHCAACDPGTWWERAVDWLLFTRSGRAAWWVAGSAAVFGLTVVFQRMGWYS